MNLARDVKKQQEGLQARRVGKVWIRGSKRQGPGYTGHGKVKVPNVLLVSVFTSKTVCQQSQVSDTKKKSGARKRIRSENPEGDWT